MMHPDDRMLESYKTEDDSLRILAMWIALVIILIVFPAVCWIRTFLWI